MTATAYRVDPLVNAGAQWASRKGLRPYQYSVVRVADHAHVSDCRFDMVNLAAVVTPSTMRGYTTHVEATGRCPICEPTPVVPDAASVVEVAAAARIHGGTRVLTLTVEQNDLGVHVATLRAYDSNHPGDEFLSGVYSDSDRAWVIETATSAAAGALRPSVDDEACNCWAGWDPSCGRPGCWGVHHPLTPASANS